jgi:lactonase
MTRLLCMSALGAALILIGAAAHAAENKTDLPALDIPRTLRSAVPLPTAESELPSVEAREYFKVSEKGLQLECPTMPRAIFSSAKCSEEQSSA